MNEESREVFIAKTQRNLSYLFLLGFFAMLVLQGMGWVDIELDLKEMVMLVLTFWFLRARPNGASQDQSAGNQPTGERSESDSERR